MSKEEGHTAESRPEPCSGDGLDESDMARLSSLGVSLPHANFSFVHEGAFRQTKELLGFAFLIGWLQAGCKELKTDGSAELEKLKLQLGSGHARRLFKSIQVSSAGVASSNALLSLLYEWTL